MSDRRVFWLDCGADLDASPPAGTPRPPCARCGARRINVLQWSTTTGGGSSSVRSVARSHHDAVARLDALRAAVPDVESAADERDFDRAQQAVKQALEAIHELEDSREENDGNKRNEWSSAQWTADELGLWRAHVGARNAAHHFSSHVVHVVGGSNHAASRDDLRWEDELFR